MLLQMVLTLASTLLEDGALDVGVGEKTLVVLRERAGLVYGLAVRRRLAGQKGACGDDDREKEEKNGKEVVCVRASCWREVEEWSREEEGETKAGSEQAGDGEEDIRLWEHCRICFHPIVKVSPGGAFLISAFHSATLSRLRPSKPSHHVVL